MRTAVRMGMRIEAREQQDDAATTGIEAEGQGMRTAVRIEVWIETGEQQGDAKTAVRREVRVGRGTTRRHDNRHSC